MPLTGYPHLIENRCMFTLAQVNDIHDRLGEAEVESTTRCNLLHVTQSSQTILDGSLAPLFLRLFPSHDEHFARQPYHAVREHRA